ncbi:MAG: 2-C-methyl-D-erythritol 4-phosphate cytidylyltransferase [Gammaproteobacteria bacterium]|nr:2-C-methyl-D-erythritol 4-phosphate cytidylyltransferase [Gammaproteobacteria bacterium]MCP5137673.1 2-C-methyl-D-erythritol 4-phosphate cytidylyltransferase [Gammaproteobacteria bacterium]
MPVKHWAVIPAAGVGKRMKSATPKQYLALAGKTVIEHSLSALCSHPLIAGAVVAVTETDPYWKELNPGCDGKPLFRAAGGAERCHSVLNALDVLREVADAADWVLVHDAARPCLSRDDLDRLLVEAGAHPVGGILAVPVRDTMKRANASVEIARTENRDGLWHALTPQMFRLGELRSALRDALQVGALVTDDASALERLGKAPRLVEGSASNIKITRPEDLALAEFHLTHSRR